MTPADLANLEVLEQKIKRTVELVSRLKSENATLAAQMSNLKAHADAEGEKARELESMRISRDELSRQVASLTEERKTVLHRVDGLLEDLAKLPLD